MTNEQNNTDEKKGFIIWSYKEYKKNLNYSNLSDREKYNKEKIILKDSIKILKDKLKEFEKNKPIKQKATKEGYKEIVIRQRDDAKRFNYNTLENKDSEVLK